MRYLAPTFRLTLAAVMALGFMLAGCGAASDDTAKDFTGLSGRISQEAEVNFSKAHLLWSTARQLRGREPEVCSNPEKAIEHLDITIRLEPAYAPAYAYRALAKSDLGQNSEAFVDISRAIKLDPTPTYYAYRGLVLLRDKKYARAREDLDVSLEMASSQPQAWKFLGMIAEATGKKEEACELYEKACSYGDCSRMKNCL